MMEYVVIHYHEVGLKGKNRPFFEKQLTKNIRFALYGLPVQKIQRPHGRILVEMEGEEGKDFFWKDVEERLQKVLGIANFARGYYTPLESMELLCQKIGEKVFHLKPASFAIRSKRADSSYYLTSPQINAEIGAYIHTRSGWPVCLTNPDLLIQVEMMSKHVIFYTQKIQGPGGLPVGVSEKVLCLISGGIDSPVAAYRLLKRGSRVEFIHFHSFPFTNKASIEKVRDVVTLLSKHRYKTKLYEVPFAEVQRQIVAKTPAPYRVILYRRFMARIAEKLALQTGSLALLTGESLGQVASQTLKNLASIEAVLQIPILRPLIGMDKIEIIADAEKIGTFEISSQPHEDCCSYLMPRNPITHSTPEEMDEVESGLPIDELVDLALKAREETVY